MVGRAYAPPCLLERGKEALRVLDVEAVAIDYDGQVAAELLERGLVVDGAHDEIVALGVGLHTVGVGDGDVEDGISGLRAEVSHKGEEHLKLVGGGDVGKDDGGLGEIGETGEGVAGVGVELEVG